MLSPQNDSEDYLNQYDEEEEEVEEDPTNVFIQNLPKTVNASSLKHLCSKFGQVESVKIMV